MYNYPKLKKDISNTGIGVLELSDTIKDNIRESFNTHSLKELITKYGTLFLNTNSGNIDEGTGPPLPWPYKNDYEYDSTIIPKIKEKILEINKTMEGKDITYVATEHNSETGREENMESPLYDFFGPYEKLTILRKYIVDNFKSSVFQMWYDIPLQNIINPSGVDVTKIHQELTKIYLELYGHLKEVENFGREYNPNESIQQTFRIQVYEEGCHIESHQDGGGGHCAMLVYTNEDYVEGKGGELVSEYKPGRNKDVETITVPPTIGTLAIVDFKKDPLHAVNVVKEPNWMRTVIGCWWPPGNIYNLS
tara:strand:+ start:623 stop:1543 length:921 start_codon:yes stop_codon:yes gene_type:complete